MKSKNGERGYGNECGWNWVATPKLGDLLNQFREVMAVRISKGSGVCNCGVSGSLDFSPCLFKVLCVLPLVSLLTSHSLPYLVPLIRLLSWSHV